MIVEGKKIWVFTSWLVDQGISDYTVRDALRRNRQGKINSWKHKSDPDDRRIKMIDFDSIPESTKAKLPTREELVTLAKANTTEAQLDTYLEACDNLSQLHRDHTRIIDYHFFLKQISDKVKAEDLKESAGWLRLLNAYRTPKQTRTINFDKKADLRKAVVEKLINDAKAKKGKHLYGFKITNVAVLQRKELAWNSAYDAVMENAETDERSMVELERDGNEAALRTLIHTNFGNNHRRVLGRLNEIESERIMLPSGKIDFSEWNAKTLCYLFSNPGRANKYDFENLYKRYEFECRKNNRQTEVELSAVKAFLTNKEVKIYLKREHSGWAEYDKMLPHVFGERPDFSLTKGGYDGFQVDFSSKIGKSQLMLTVVAVFDYMSEAITGVDIGLVEDGLMVRNMYRNHLNLNGGRSYIEIESDRFSGNLAEETAQIFKQTCQYVTQPTPNDPQGKAPNPKARFVERLIQELNRCAQNFPGWKGTNITSIDKNRKPNPDYRSGNYLEGYTESKEQIITLINIYNCERLKKYSGKSRIQMFKENVNPEAPQIPAEFISLLLNQSTITTVRNGKIEIEVNRRMYEYEFPDFDQHVYKMMKGYKVKVHFDETDMSTVDVFGENDQYIGSLGKLTRVKRDKWSQAKDPEHTQRMGKMIANRNATDERITRKSLEVEAAMYGIDIANLSIADALETIEGARMTSDLHITAEELYADALATPDAIQAKNYYEDRMIRSEGEAVPVTIQKSKGLESTIRDHVREKFNRRKKDSQ